MPSLAFHDVTGSTLAHCPGKPASAARGVRHQPKSAFGFVRNRCTTWAEIAVQLPPKWLFGFARPTHLRMTPIVLLLGWPAIARVEFALVVSYVTLCRGVS